MKKGDFDHGLTMNYQQRLQQQQQLVADLLRHRESCCLKTWRLADHVAGNTTFDYYLTYSGIPT